MRGRHLFALVALSLCTACPSQGPAPASSATPSSAPALSAAATALDAGADAPAIQPDLASVPPPARIPVDLQDELDRAVSLAIEKGEVPGAVVLLGDEQGPIFRRAYGRRAIEPQSLPMQESTLFDLASLTKPLVTGMLALKLVEDGKLGLDVPLERYLPELRDGSRQSVTVRQLLTHTSGLPPVNVLKHYQGSRDDIVKRALSVAPRRGAADGGHEPYAYSDLGFIWLMHLIERVSGQRLDELAQARLFAPLKLTSTTFNPPPELAQRSALTEPFGDAGFQPGKVHDPRARGLSGVSGHAGLFSTADDLGRYAKGPARTRPRAADHEAVRTDDCPPRPRKGRSRPRLADVETRPPSRLWALRLHGNLAVGLSQPEGLRRSCSPIVCTQTARAKPTLSASGFIA